MNHNRKKEALRVRITAAELASNRIHPTHIANGDEHKFRGHYANKNKPSYLASFTKGMSHQFENGLICNPDDFQQFVKGIDSGDPRDFIDTPLGSKDKKWKSCKAKNNNVGVRGWESQAAGP